MDKSKSTYMYLIIFVLLCKTVLTVFPVKHPILQMPLFNWVWILGIGLAGFFTLNLAGKAGFREIWDTEISNRKRILLPVLVGAVFSVFQVYFSVRLDFPNFNVPFPHSVPAYLAFGTVYEIAFHLIPIGLLTWFVSVVILKKKHNVTVFIIAALVISIFEPCTQINGLIEMGLLQGPWMIWSFAVYIYLANVIPLVFFWKYGFLSMVSFRYADYLIWHIIWPLLYYSAHTVPA